MSILRRLAGLGDVDEDMLGSQKTELSINNKSLSSSNPKSYEEACNLAYDLMEFSPRKAINVIKYINEQSLPVKIEDICYVNSMASLAYSPVFREMKIAKNLFEKVIAIKNNDFESNSAMFFLSLTDLTEESKIKISKKYAKNLLNANYIQHLKERDLPISRITNKYVDMEKNSTYNLYKTILEFFIDFGDRILAERTKEIINEIEKINI